MKATKSHSKRTWEIDEGKDEVTSLSKQINKAKMPKLKKEKMPFRT